MPLPTLNPGQWGRIPNTKISSVLPNPLPPGWTGPASIVIAWNGGAYDSKRERILIGCAGGHADYTGNEIYAVEVVAGTISRIWGPTPNAQIPASGGTHETYPD